jgi:hypothetical protein
MLSQKTRYALQALLELAALPAGATLSRGAIPAVRGLRCLPGLRAAKDFSRAARQYGNDSRWLVTGRCARQGSPGGSSGERIDAEKNRAATIDRGVIVERELETTFAEERFRGNANSSKLWIYLAIN